MKNLLISIQKVFIFVLKRGSSSSNFCTCIFASHDQ